MLPHNSTGRAGLVAGLRWNHIGSAGVGKREQSNATFARGDRPTRSMRRHGRRGRVLGIEDPRRIKAALRA